MRPSGLRIFCAGAPPDGGRLYRTYRDGRAHLDAVLEDYAYLAEGLVDLYEAGGNERYLMRPAIGGTHDGRRFGSHPGGVLYHRQGARAMIMRSREGPDGATPSGNARPQWSSLGLRTIGRDEFVRQPGAIRAYGRQLPDLRALCQDPPRSRPAD